MCDVNHQQMLKNFFFFSLLVFAVVVVIFSHWWTRFDLHLPMKRKENVIHHWWTDVLEKDFSFSSSFNAETLIFHRPRFETGTVYIQLMTSLFLSLSCIRYHISQRLVESIVVLCTRIPSRRLTNRNLLIDNFFFDLTSNLFRQRRKIVPMEMIDR